ncbi:uncharacterized protein DFE_2257 [Desulfovibrio ferrophilus]|uniref:Uncharacterized protein n=1 Tax=Desulfovibrio ferrophilus TaxID=241368 RepID=A0A2Z6B0I6_9BACT|nr:uncharacterized protein DFE_2257 [Desulfovibrio ferrophilus]
MITLAASRESKPAENRATASYFWLVLVMGEVPITMSRWQGKGGYLCAGKAKMTLLALSEMGILNV